MSDELSTTCPNCGAVLPEGLEACSHCGAMLAQPDALDDAPNALLPAQPAPEAVRQPSPPAPVLAIPGVRVNRVATTKVNLKIPQEAVDKQRWLTPEEWERLLAAFGAAMGEQMKTDLQAGQTLDIAAESGTTAIAWDQVGDALTPEQRAEIEQTLHRLFTSAAQVTHTTQTGNSTLPQVIAAPPKVKASASCSLLVFMVGLMAAGATFYFLAR